MAVLYFIALPRGSTFDSVCQMYVAYVTQKYGAAVVVFDGYIYESANKDATLRRTGVCAGVTVHFDGDMMIQSKKEDFLNNKANKQRFIHYLSNKLERAGCSIDHVTHDADVLIVQTAVGSAQTKDTVLLVGGWHRLADSPTAPCRNGRTRVVHGTRAWCMRQSRELLGPKLCDHLLFVHAMSGCDTTSRLFGLGKGVAVQKIENDPVFYNQAKVFSQPDQAKEVIIAAG